MKFFENTRKPQGFGGKLMTKMMNSGHTKLSQWGFSKYLCEDLWKVWIISECGNNVAAEKTGKR